MAIMGFCLAGSVIPRGEKVPQQPYGIIPEVFMSRLFIPVKEKYWVGVQQICPTPWQEVASFKISQFPLIKAR